MLVLVLGPASTRWKRGEKIDSGMRANEYSRDQRQLGDDGSGPRDGEVSRRAMSGSVSVRGIG